MKRFSRRTEDFVCEHCNTEVKGNGYTNHCPHCLYSKHVDINPGDRASDCGGLMEPIDIEQKNGGYIVIQRCLRCGFIRKNKITAEDNFEAVLNIIRHKTTLLRKG
ncbi:MAG: RNHCP domain-containing protein [Alphaproteobacteria bacterium]|nr:RNHCP domain-containing protein [Alphaproteobacteria bacterium]